MCTPGWLVGRRAPAVRRDDAFAWRLSLSAARAAPTTSWRRYVLALALADRNPPARCATSLLSRPRGRPPAAQRPARGDRRAQRPVGLRQAGVGASVPRLPSRRGSRRSRAAHPAPPHRPWCSGIVETQRSDQHVLEFEIPAPVVADALGHHHVTTAKLAAQAGATWSRYASGDHLPSPSGWSPPVSYT